MKKGKKIVPQHIPNGQNYTEESLRELNSELSKFAYLALILYLGSEIGLFILSIIFVRVIGGVIGYVLALLMILAMPLCIVLVAKISQKGYMAAAERIGLTPELLKETLDNRNKSVAAWGVIPDETPEQVIKKPIDKKKVLKVVSIITAVIFSILIIFLVYDAYKTSISNRMIVEISAEEGEISESDYKDIISILEKRADLWNKNDDSGNIPIELKCESENGKIKCTSNSNMLTEYNYDQFYTSGKISIIDEAGNIVITEDQILDFEFTKGSAPDDNKLKLTFSDEAFEKLRSTEGNVFINTEFTDITARNVPYCNSASYLVENAEGTTCSFNGVPERMSYSLENKLPYRVNVDILETNGGIND